MIDEGNGHLSPEDISGYLAGALSGTQREGVEDHLSLCPVCRQELIQASRAPGPRQSVRWMLAAVPAVAAAALAFLFLAPDPDAGPAPNPSSDSILRHGSEGDPAGFVLLSPDPDQILDGGGISFTWGLAEEGASYQLTVAGPDGDVLWTGRTMDTVLTLPDSVSLEVGVSYFWYVDALLSGAQTTSTSIQQFSVGR